MSDFLGWFVHKPLRIAAIGVAFLLLWLGLRGRRTPAGRNAMLYPAAVFFVLAGWEWLVMTRTPDANIRVDLLLTWPLALIVVVWAVIRSLRR